MASLLTSATVPSEPFLYAKLAIVLEEHDAVALGEVAFAAFDADGAVIGRQLARNLNAGFPSEFSALFQYCPCL
jgi:hypothetical protein